MKATLQFSTLSLFPGYIDEVLVMSIISSSRFIVLLAKKTKKQTKLQQGCCSFPLYASRVFAPQQERVWASQTTHTESTVHCWITSDFKASSRSILLWARSRETATKCFYAGWVAAQLTVPLEWRAPRSWLLCNCSCLCSSHPPATTDTESACMLRSLIEKCMRLCRGRAAMCDNLGLQTLQNKEKERERANTCWGKAIRWKDN